MMNPNASKLHKKTRQASSECTNFISYPEWPPKTIGTRAATRGDLAAVGGACQWLLDRRARRVQFGSIVALG